MSTIEQTVLGFDWAGRIYSDGWVDAPETIETVEPLSLIHISEPTRP